MAPRSAPYNSPLVPAALLAVWSRGGDVEALRARYGLGDEVLADKTAALPLDAFRQFMEECALAAGEPSLGFRLATTMPRGGLGVFDLSARTAPTLRDAALRFVRYLPLVNPGLRASFEERSGAGVLRQWVDGEPLGQGRQSNEFVPAAVLRAAREQVDPNLCPIEVFFAHEAPSDEAALGAFFRAPMRFGCGANGVTMCSAALDRAQHSADRDLGALLDAYAERMLGGPAATFAERVRAAVARALEGGEPSLASVAKCLGMGERTLQRRLIAEAKGFRGLVDQVRRDRALLLIRDPSHSIADVAYLLGYAELGPFFRAFRRWTGTTPGDYRRSPPWPRPADAPRSSRR